MVCLGLEPGAAGWKAQTNPLSYGSTPTFLIFNLMNFSNGGREPYRPIEYDVHTEIVVYT